MSAEEELKILRDLGDEVVWGGPEGWSQVEALPDDTSHRWHIYSGFILESPNGNFYEVSYQRGATEYQECDPDAVVIQVWPKRVEITIYVGEKPEGYV